MNLDTRNANKREKRKSFKKIVCPECFGELNLLVDCWAIYQIKGKVVSKEPTISEFDHRFLECPDCSISGNTNDSFSFNQTLHDLLDEVEYQ